MVLRSEILTKKSELPTPDQALPGRESAMPVPEAHFVNGRPLTAPFPAGLQQVLFGMGCFWGAERRLWQQPGVWVTAVGYAGGYTPNPTYDEVCSGLTGHSEVVLVVYNPQETSFEQLLKVFWEAHDPTQGMRQGGDIGTQYRSVIYTFDAAQKAAALASRELPSRTGESRLRPHHHRDRRRPALLLRRGLPPAVPGEEPQRLLRPGRHRGVPAGLTTIPPPASRDASRPGSGP